MSLDKKRIKSILLRVIGASMYYSGAYFILDRLFNNKGVYILMYHKIAGEEDESYYQDIAVKKEELVRQLEYLRSRYSLIGMDEAVSILGSNKSLDRDHVVFTLDDGYSDNLFYGMELFGGCQAKPIVYLTAGKLEDRAPIWTEVVDYIVMNSGGEAFELYIEGNKLSGDTHSKKGQAELADRIKKALARLTLVEINAYLNELLEKLDIDKYSLPCRLLDWDGVKRLMASGWEIGSHTLNHVNLAIEDPKLVLEELKVSGELIGDRIGCKVKHFAYPYGKENNYNSFVVDSVRKYYRSAVTTTEGINRCGDDLYHLQRIMVANHHSIMDIRIKLLKVKITDFFRGRRGSNQNTQCQ